MRYEFHIHKDFGGIPAEDKERVMEQLMDGPKTTKEITATTGMEWRRTRNAVFYLATIGVVEQVGRYHQAKVWRVKA